MKVIIKKIIILLIIPFLISCSEREVPFENLVRRYDPEIEISLFFEVNSNTPFTGISRQYHDNGQLRVEQRYQNGILQTGSSWFHDNGQLNFVESLNENGLLFGEMTYYDKYGVVVGIVNYISGRPQGVYTLFDESGEINEEGMYVMRSMSESYSIRHLGGQTSCLYHDIESLRNGINSEGETVWYIVDRDKEIYSTMNYFTDCPGDFELTIDKYRLN